MNETLRRLGPTRPLDLGGEPDFVLGALLVQPTLRQVSAGERRKTIEPRVMQVLVVLSRANGTVVSREQMIDRCWGGRIVGDDAINSCLAKVRALADFAETPSFDIETIPRVGYRLRELREAAKAPLASPAASDSLIRPPVASRNTGRWRWIALAAVAVVIASVLAVALYFSVRREPEWIVAESHLPFISTPAIERYPALAPDRTMIAYSAGPSINDRQIYLRLLKGGDPIQLTHEAGDASAPAWSPDGKTIAYVVFQPSRPCKIMEIPVPAGQPRQVGQSRFSERSSLAFDPSGHALYFADALQRGAANRIFKLDLDDGHVFAVTHSGNREASDDSPSLSPGGGELLYHRNIGGTKTQIRVLSLSNRDGRIVAEIDDDSDANAAWSADGHTIFIARSQGNDNALWAYPARGGEPWRILSTGEYLGRLSAGPNGLLAMEMQYPGGQLVSVTPHSNSPPKPIDSGGLKTWCVDYSRDGTFLATGWRVDGWGIWTSGENGSLHQLVNLPGPACAIRWSPDGSRFAFIIPRGHGFDVPVMTRGGELIVRLHFDAKDSGVIDWTVDGKSILTSRPEAKGWRIWKTNLATPGKSVPITPYGWRDPRVHGNMLFAEKDGAAGIWRIDGTPHRMTDGPAPEGSDVYNIAGDRLIYSDTSDPKHPMFSAVSVNGGPKDRLGPLPNGQIDFTFGVDPKSGDIVFTERTDDTDIGLLRLVKR